jgi:hypothetical protein
MIEEYTEHPKWTYKPIEIENLEEIQNELMQVLYKEMPDFLTASPQFLYVLRSRIEPHAPLYTKFIESLGLLDRWLYSALITTNNNEPFPIHVDSLNWKTRCYGLNLPLVNCAGTYTVFYDADINAEQFTDVSDPINSARVIQEGVTATEIDRYETVIPAWVNTRIPHAPVSTHGMPRALISARFKPELHDILYK